MITEETANLTSELNVTRVIEILPNSKLLIVCSLNKTISTQEAMFLNDFF